MKRQAILITAYRDAGQLLEIISFFDSRFEFYIHVDRRSRMETAHLERKPNVHIYRAYSVHWGSRNHLKAILLLAGEALKNAEIDYLHLITEQDFPVKPLSFFTDTFDTSCDHIRRIPVPCPDWESGGGLDRINYYNFYDLLDAKKAGCVINFFVRIQKLLKIKRKYPAHLPKLYAGSTYWSLRRETVQYVVDYTDRNPQLLERMKHTFCPEEFYIPTVLMTAPFAGSFSDNHLRYIDWSSGRGGYPAYLDESDFPVIVGSGRLFARKFNCENQRKLHRYLTDPQATVTASSESSCLRRAQLRMLDILIVFDGICRRHNIDYWLASGTLLGARRYGGFIPWDDDLDVEIRQKDHHRLLRVLERELPPELRLQCRRTDKNYWYYFPKIRDTRSEVLEPETLKYNFLYRGIFIDIFPMEPFFSTFIKRRLDGILVRTARRRFAPSRLQRVFNYVALLFYPFARLFIAATRLAFLFLPKTKYTDIPGKETCDARLACHLFPLGSIRFEGRFFPAPHDTDGYLTGIYGKDFMTPPPPEQRGRHTQEIRFVQNG
ncbi:MAG: LicD family protein [Dysgonamonadaceae bacterium]|jgi:phosphorylcholine metabolism protein LicD|nr:LicD family protein [Dysgonamonadaceae bacterium]